ncbi:aldehyde ferredoxin oxidoreductase family protein [Candidatus Hakubella thermalkaliphila]|uniref:Aldehyde:ferredoxin oxidoreductase n=1 Tax=Candidatus Hakubella thermalkaliphila TaxID=2754717 RepID=A0A6V8Q6S0_9ACTN|nr:aldehyde ferredoxin oxidoreductase family protein [Candidatus Hakubella thermalkaliphila]GFP39774.1 aldehyde:ferredoxin oxidoreductase [Candidatus Hakubella thermalkaliphila]
MYLYAGKIAKADLTQKKITIEETNRDWIDQYVGGMGLGFRYFFSQVRPDVDPLSPQNAMVFMNGPLAESMAPLSCRLPMVSKSPQTGTIFESNVGGAIAAELKYAGYDGIIIKGKSDQPVYIAIKDDRVEIKDAQGLWGKGIFETEEKLKSMEKDEEVKSFVIGPAGENLVPMACIGTEAYRQLGRGGTGAIMGSKNLKAITVRGTQGVQVADMKGFLDYTSEIFQSNLLTVDNLWAHTDGTPAFVASTNDMGIHPTLNFQQGTFEHWEKIDSVAVKSIKRRARACRSCPMACGNFVRTEKVMVEGPEYETLALAGSNCGISNIEAVAQFNEICDDLGLDTISTGNIIAFAMEMTEKKIYDFGVTFGDEDNYLRIPKEIATLSGRGKEMAQGVRSMAARYGGKEFAMEVKGLEMPGYEPRGNWGMGLAYATSERGACHLRAFTAFSETPYDLAAMAQEVVYQQNFNSVKWPMCLCDFWGTFNTDIMTQFLKFGLGKNISAEQLDQIGERIWNLSRIFNLRAGMKKVDDDLPPRIKKDPLIGGRAQGKVLSEEDLETMLQTYYELRGWDKEGVPTQKKLSSLGLADL